MKTSDQVNKQLLAINVNTWTYCILKCSRGGLANLIMDTHLHLRSKYDQIAWLLVIGKTLVEPVALFCPVKVTISSIK